MKKIEKKERPREFFRLIQFVHFFTMHYALSKHREAELESTHHHTFTHWQAPQRSTITQVVVEAL